jgi:hypothetical protein
MDETIAASCGVGKGKTIVVNWTLFDRAEKRIMTDMRNADEVAAELARDLIVA